MKDRKIKITAVERDEPKVGRYILAMIELARQLQADEEADQFKPGARQEKEEGAA
jgi:hypothetical protein